MTARASRMDQRLASVAVSEKLQRARPKRRVSSAPTHSASSVGSIAVAPPSSANRLRTASATTAGEWRPSHPCLRGEVDVLVAVDVGDAGATRGVQVAGNAPAVLFIHVIGTRPKRWSARW